MGKLNRENSDLFKPELDDLEDDEDEEDDDRGLASTQRRGSESTEDDTIEDFESESIRKAERLLIRIALRSRLLVIGTAFAASLIVGTPFDTSTSLQTQMDNTPYALQCPANWDGAYYIRIAMHGYEYEESHAFFPLFPIVARLVGKGLFQGWFTNNEALAIALGGAFWNNIIFVFTAVILFRLGCLVLKDDKLAMRAAVLFCYNPASIFFSVAYSESMFALLAFSGMYFLVSARRNSSAVNFNSRLVATLFFALATMTRSNGAVLGLFSIWAVLNSLMESKRDKVALFRSTVELGIVGVIHLLGLLSVLGYGWYLYCWETPIAARPWCSKWVPNIYSFVQGQYWNVGIFRYYEKKQIPNFILAAPSVALTFEGVVHYTFKKPGMPWPFLVQALLSIAVGMLVMHVQVYTRLIASSSPLFYWYCAELTRSKTPISYFVCMYFAFYTMLGTAMFCSYFPWT